MRMQWASAETTEANVIRNWLAVVQATIATTQMQHGNNYDGCWRRRVTRIRQLFMQPVCQPTANIERARETACRPEELCTGTPMMRTVGLLRLKHRASFAWASNLPPNPGHPPMPERRVDGAGQWTQTSRGPYYVTAPEHRNCQAANATRCCTSSNTLTNTSTNRWEISRFADAPRTR